MRTLRLLVFPLVLLAVTAIFLWQGILEQKKIEPRRIAMAQLTAVDDETVSGFQEAKAELGYREGSEVIYVATGPIGTVDRLE